MASFNPLGQAGFTGNEGAFAMDSLLSDGHDITSLRVAPKAGAFVTVQKRGTILKYDPVTVALDVVVAVADCNCVLAEDYDPTRNPPTNTLLIYLTGKMKSDQIIWPGALAHSQVTDNLRKTGIYIENVLGPTGGMVKNAPTEAEAAAAKKLLEDNRNRKPPAKDGEADPIQQSDNPLPYMTPEEREKRYELSAVRPLAEVEQGALKKDGHRDDDTSAHLRHAQPGPHAPPMPPGPHGPTHSQPAHDPHDKEHKK